MEHQNEHTLFETITDPVLTINRDWQITYINRNGAAIAELTPDRIIGRVLWEAFPQMIGSPLETHYRQAMESREPVHFTAKGSVRDLWFSISVYPNDDGILIYTVNDDERQESENLKRKLLEENQHQKSLLESIFEADPAALAVLVGEDLRFVYANPAYRFICPNPGEDPVGKSYNQVWPHASKYRSRDRFRQVLATGQPFQVGGITYRFIDSTERIFNLQARRIEWENRPAVLVIYWDTTEQNRVEQALRESESRFTTIFQHAPVVLALSRLEDGAIVDVNLAFEKLFGFSKEEVVGHNSSELGIAPDPQERARLLAEFKKQGSLYGLELIYRSKSGQNLSLRGNLEKVTIGQDQYILNSYEDITERKQSQQALEKALERAESSQRRLEALMSYIPEGITIADAPDATIRMVSRYGQEILGGPHSQKTAEQVADEWKVYQPDGVTPLPAEELPLVRAIEKGEVVSNQDLVQVNAQGQALYLSCSAGPILDAQGKITGAVVAWRDVAERRRVEEALRESEARYRDLFAGMQEALFAVEIITNERGEPVDWRYLEVNPQLERWMRMTRDQMIGRTYSEVVRHPDPAWIALLGKVAQTGQPVSQEIYSPYRGRWLQVSAYATQPGQVAALFYDINERKLAEQQIAAEKEWFSTALISIGDAVITTDPEGRVTFLNPEAEKLTGWTNAEAAGEALETVFRIINEKTRQTAENPVGKVLRSGQACELANHTALISRDGRVIPVEDSAAPIRDASGQVLGAVMVFRDVAEKRRVEDQLRQLSTLIELSYEPILTWELDGCILTWNQGCEKLYGYPREEAIGRVSHELLRTQHPITLEALEAQLLREGAWSGELRHRTKDGRQVIIESRHQLMEIEGRQLVLETNRDITDRKQAEQALREALQAASQSQSDAKASETRANERAAELETLMNTIPAFVWVSHDPECRQMISNPFGYEFLNLQAGSNVSMTAPPGEFPQQHRVMRNGRVLPGEEMPMQVAARTGKPQLGFDFEVVFDQGMIYQLYGNAAPLLDASGKPSGAVGVFLDVTNVRTAEQETRRLAAENEIKHRLLEQREQERLKIARDLHDGPIQEILGAMYTIQGILAEDETSNLAGELKGVADVLQRQVSELRDYAGGLRPPALSKFGLEKSIRGYAEVFQEKHPENRVTIEAAQEGPLLPEEMRLAIFRIYQEAMNNVARHSPNAEVRILLEKEPHEARLQIEDNGPGFEVPEDWLEMARAGHLGLVGMRERAEAIGGKLEVESKPDKGTCVRLKVPLK